MPGFVSDEQRRLGVHGDRLRSDAAGPKHRHLAGIDRHRIAEVGSAQIADADGAGIAEMNRGAVSPRKT